MHAAPVVYADIRAADQRIADVVLRTPLINVPAIDKQLGARVLFKAEPLQRTGSFKFRGACNAVRAYRPDRVVAFSSGNHAQGVAAAAALAGIRATVVMPSDAPQIKIERTRSYGADVRLYDRYRELREEIGAQIADETGARLIKPYDDPFVIAGQGTVGLEMAEQALAQHLHPDLAVICCGGGGLIAGCSLALRARLPDIQIYAAEPEAFDDTRRSLAAGERQTNPPEARSICDALLASTPGELTFAINRETLNGGVTASDASVRRAVRLAAMELKLVVEPGGAIALAALLEGALDIGGKTVLVMLSGGNIDPSTLAEIVGGTG